MKKLIALLLALVMVVGLCACTVTDTSADPTEPKDNQGEDATTGGDAAAATEITLWTYPIGNWVDQATVDGLIADFNAVHPEIKVTVEFLD